MPQTIPRIAGTNWGAGDTDPSTIKRSQTNSFCRPWSDSRRRRLRGKERYFATLEWSYCAMTKSFLINTSVAAIVSAFVLTAGVSSARAWDDSYREASSNRGPLYYPNRDTWGNHGGHYPKRYSRNPYDSYGSFGGYGSYRHYPKRHPRHPYDSYGSYGGYGSYVGHYPKRYSRNPYDNYGSFGSYVGHYPKRHS